VQVQAGESHRLDRGRPRHPLVEVRPPQRATVLASEDWGVLYATGVDVKVPEDVRPHSSGQRQRAQPAFDFGGPTINPFSVDSTNARVMCTQLPSTARF